MVEKPEELSDANAVKTVKKIIVVDNKQEGGAKKGITSSISFHKLKL
jgi:hypothetical protein